MKENIQKRLDREHAEITKIEKEDECYTPPYGDERTNYIERSYVAGYNPVDENLTFYLRKKGKNKGKYVALYRNQKGKSVAVPYKEYLKKVDKLLENQISPIRKIDVEILDHIRRHIRYKVIKNHREVIRDLIKARQRRRESIED